MMTKPDIKFYDTSSLLLAGESAFEEFFLISSITLQELESIKTNGTKDEQTKADARLISRLLASKQNTEAYEVFCHRELFNNKIINSLGDSFIINNDLRILADAVWANDSKYVDEVIFVTNDILLKEIAYRFFPQDMIQSIENTDYYMGYKEVKLEDEQLAHFYEHLDCNHFDSFINEYIIIKNKDDEVVDIVVWNGQGHQKITYKTFNSDWLGEIKPFKSDVYQQILFDCLSRNKLTMITGPAGSGKSYISIGYLMQQLEKRAIDTIIVFCNPIATANSAKLGFYPGSKDEKLLDSQIGHMLAAKLGGQDALERLMADRKLILLPLADLRGFDTTGMKAGIYISEAQNLDRTLMKLALSRVGDDCICIIDGDAAAQVDSVMYAGNNNGMKRASKVYRGVPFYGEVMLKNVYRSEIAKYADLI